MDFCNLFYRSVEEKVFRPIHDQIELVINLEHALAMIERLPSQSRKAFNYEAQIAKIEDLYRYFSPEGSLL